MVGWLHWLDGCEFEQALGVGVGQGSLAYCSPWGRKESHTSWQLKWTELMGFTGGSVVKNPPANSGDVCSIPGSGRSPGEGTGYPLQYSCLENPMDGGAWWAIVLGITNSWKWLNDSTTQICFLLLPQEIPTSVFASSSTDLLPHHWVVHKS